MAKRHKIGSSYASVPREVIEKYLPKRSPSKRIDNLDYYIDAALEAAIASSPIYYSSFNESLRRGIVASTYMGSSSLVHMIGSSTTTAINNARSFPAREQPNFITRALSSLAKVF